MGSDALVRLEQVAKRYVLPDGSAQEIVRVEQWALAPSAHVALEGPSGSGKTTLLHLIAGIIVADEGTVSVAGKDMGSLSEPVRDRWRAQHIGYIFQTFNLLQGLTALENVELAMRFVGEVDHGRASHLLERVGLAEKLHHKPRQLSVGQQQRVAVARALANRPALVLADEPTGNLDAAHAQTAVALIRDLCRETKAALLLVSHDSAVLRRFEQVMPLSAINHPRSEVPA